jgi:tryptophan-rich sensory protein
MKKIVLIGTSVAVCLAVGASAAYFQSGAIEEWYPTLVKPDITPPNWVFPIAWTIIYVCMGISIGLMLSRPYFVRLPAILLFSWQLLLNFLWSILFFAMHDVVLGFIDIVLLDIAVILYMMNVYRVSKGAAWLFAPYVLWLAFASYLSTYILVMT